MRLLVIGHTYTRPWAQRTYAKVRELGKDVELRLVVPDRPPMWGIQSISGVLRTPELSPHEVVVLPRRGGRSNPTYMLDSAALAWTLREFQPTVIHIEEDFHSFMAAEAVASARRHCPDTPISFFTWDNLRTTRHFPINQVKALMSRRVLSHVSLVLCGSSEARDLLPERGFTGPAMVVRQIGFDPLEYQGPPPPAILDRIGAELGEPIIGHVGRLVPEKGTLELLEALSGLQDLPWRLVLVGRGPLEEEIRTRWAPLLGNRLVMIGAVPRPDVAGYLRCIDVLAVPPYGIRRWKEQGSEILLQGMMAGCACIGSKSGVVPELLGDAGILVAERDVVALRQALTRLLTVRDLRKQLGAAAQARAHAHFTHEAVAREHLSAFRTLDARERLSLPARARVRANA